DSAAACGAERSSLVARAAAHGPHRAPCRAPSTSLSEQRTRDTAALPKLQAHGAAPREEVAPLRSDRADARRRHAPQREAEQRLAQMIDGGTLTVHQKDGNLVVELPSEVVFPSGKAELSRAGELAFMELAIVLRKMPERRFLVVGHTDDVPVKAGPFTDNWQ